MGSAAPRPIREENARDMRTRRKAMRHRLLYPRAFASTKVSVIVMYVWSVSVGLVHWKRAPVLASANGRSLIIFDTGRAEQS